MALFSSESAAQDISAPALPTVSHDDPVITLTGAGCRYMTVTLKSTTKRLKANGAEETRILTKIYKLDCQNPSQIDIDVQEKVDSNPDYLIFRIQIAPHLRGGTPSTRQHPFPSQSANLPDPVFFLTQSARPQVENTGNYEAYQLALRRQPRPLLYAPLPTSTNTEAEIFGAAGSNIYIPEFHDGQWTVMTISSLLIDLLERVDPLELQLIIVGNHNFGDPANPNQNRIEQATDRLGNTMRDAAGNIYTISDRLDEVKWDRFLLERANSLQSFVFNGRAAASIQTMPAQKINDGGTPPNYTTGALNAADDSIDPAFRSFISNRFIDASGNPNITRIDALNLRKGFFAAGSIFIWDPLNCGPRNLNLLFDTNESEVLTGNSNATQNQTQLDRIKQILDKYPNIRVRLEGHTDDVPATGYTGGNNQLSLDRAESTRNALITMGLSASRFDLSIGYGQANPNVPNNPPGTPGGTPANRRVVMLIISSS